jgi:hypothetical protein
MTQLKSKNYKGLLKHYKDMYGNLLNCETSAQSVESESENQWGKIRLGFAKQFKLHFDKEFGPNGEQMKTFTEKEINDKIINSNLKLIEYKVHDGNIGDYSPWFKKFKRNSAVDLEIPGQYTGKKKPVLEYHVKIDSFDERVTKEKPNTRPLKIIVFFLFLRLSL